MISADHRKADKAGQLPVQRRTAADKALSEMKGQFPEAGIAAAQAASEKRERGAQNWKQRTPAMSAKLTDHIWPLKELFTTVVIDRQRSTG